MNKKSIAWAFISALLISGCGGGGSGGSGGGGSTGGSGSSGITLNTAPTAKLSGSQANADNLVGEINSSTQDLLDAAGTQGAASQLGMFSVHLVPNDTFDCSTLGTAGTGSGTYTYSTNATSTLTAGTYISVTYNSCTFTYSAYTYSINGTMVITYTRYNSTTDFALTVAYTNLTSSISSSTLNYSYGPYSATYNYDYNNGAVTASTSLTNGGATNISGSSVITNGSNFTITSATYVYNSTSEGGVVKVVFDNWTYDSSVGHATSGSITITGANGDYVQIVANGTSYTVTYNINGANSAFTVNFTS